MDTVCFTRERRCISMRLLLLVPACLVLEVAQIEIGAQFAIDARQQIQIEGRGDAGGIVVGSQHPVASFTRSAPSSRHRRAGARAADRAETRGRRCARNCRWCCRETEPEAARPDGAAAVALAMPSRYDCCCGCTSAMSDNSRSQRARGFRRNIDWKVPQLDRARRTLSGWCRVFLPVPLPNSITATGDGTKSRFRRHARARAVRRRA